MSDRQCDDPRMNLNQSQFENAVAQGGTLCKQLKADDAVIFLTRNRGFRHFGSVSETHFRVESKFADKVIDETTEIAAR